MAADTDVVPAGAGKQPALLLHAVEVAVHLVTAEAEARPAAAAVNRYRHPGAGTLLFAVVAVAVLLAAHQQVTPHPRGYRLRADLRPLQRGVATAVQHRRPARRQQRFGVRQPVAAQVALRRIDAGADAQPETARGADADTDPEAAPPALVAALGLLRVRPRQQPDILRGRQRQVPAGLQLAAHHRDIALGRTNTQVVARGHAAAGHRLLRPGLLRGGRLAAVRNTYSDRLRLLARLAAARRRLRAGRLPLRHRQSCGLRTLSGAQGGFHPGQAL